MAPPVAGNLERFRRGTDLSYIESTPLQANASPADADDVGDFFARALRLLSLPSVLLLIGLGAWLRSCGAFPRATADRCRKACFQLLLPAFLLRHIWQTKLDSELYAVAAWSFLLHGLWFMMSLRMSQLFEPHNAALCGWTMLMTQGTMNSFLYPLLLKHDGFGERSLAVAVLWDLGGNMWICQLALFGIAAYYSPHGHVSQSSDVALEKVCGDPYESCDASLSHRLAGFSARGGGLLDGSGYLAFFEDASCMPRSVLMDALRQPILIACVLGFLLNIAAVPLRATVDTVLCVVGEPYKLVLYVLVGFYGDHHFRTGDAAFLGRTLAGRYAISLAIIFFVVICLPMDLTCRQTIALAVLSPTSSYLLHLVAEHGYGDILLRLTVCGTLVSTVVSTLAQHLLMFLFEVF
eukprot:TRINITY_DN123250_c0_g1_i1.p1 TRINITY_DN123250_c0_g1~~TRINITY_DN123250_c0_g1_i1.p1  ORF type:complete len:428 (+),score=66.15 TRINITY_DN123250_c0_g1_i1:61-1284(+)